MILSEKCFASLRSVLEVRKQASKVLFAKMVENSGIEPLTSCVQSRRSPS